jgi:hypothetical protein
MTGLLSHGFKQQRAAGDRLGMALRDGKAHKQRAAVVDQGSVLGHHVATMGITSGKTGPTPLILQFVEGIFRIGTVPIVLGSRSYFLRVSLILPVSFIIKESKVDSLFPYVREAT